jgi:hypothetical protein
MVKTKIAAMTVLIIILTQEIEFNNRKEPILSLTDRKTDRIRHRTEPILNLTDKRTDLIRHRNEETHNALGEIRHLRVVGSNLPNAPLKAENLPQDALGQTMEIPISNRRKESNPAHLTMEISSNAPIGIILNSVLRSHRKGGSLNAQMKSRIDLSDVAEIKY